MPRQFDRAALEGANKAAREAVRTFGLLVNDGNFEALGFSNPGEAKQATLGNPIEEFMIRLDRLQA